MEMEKLREESNGKGVVHRDNFMLMQHLNAKHWDPWLEFLHVTTTYKLQYVNI